MIIPFHVLNQNLIDSVKSIKSSRGVDVRVIAVNDTGLEIAIGEIGLESTDILVKSRGRGYLDAMSTGVSCADSEFLAFQDSDDFTDDLRLRNQILLLKNRDLDLVTGRLIQTNKSGKTASNLVVTGKVPLNLSPQKKLIFGPIGADSSMVGKTSALQSYWNLHGHFSPSFSDYGLLLTLSKFLKIDFCAEALYYYRSHELQMSRSATDLDGWEGVFLLWLQNFCDVYDSLLENRLEFFSSFKSHPKVGLCFAFPSSLPRLDSSDRRFLKYVIKYILSKESCQDKTMRDDFSEMMLRRGFIGTRGTDLKFWPAGIRMLITILVRYFKGLKPRKIKQTREI